MIVNSTKLLEKAPIKNMLPDKHSEHGVTYGLSEAGFDIRIKQDVRFKKLFGLIPMVKVGKSRWKLGRFTLASAIEEFDMPANLVGVAHDKSTWARQGLSVFNTVIEPGFIGGLTLELVYHRGGDLFSPAGAGIAQVLFHSLANEARYAGKYQFQSSDPEPARES